MFLEQRLDGSCPVQPLPNIGALVPARWSDRSLSGGGEQVGLVAVSPEIQLPTAQGSTCQRNSVEEGLPALGVVPAQTQIKAVGEFDVVEGAVGLEVGGADCDGGRVVWRTGRVNGAVYGDGERGIVEGVVLSVSAHADVGFGSCYGFDVL